MSQTHGKDGLVALSTSASTSSSDMNEVLETVSWTVDESADTYQTTEPTLNNSAPALTYEAGATSWTGSVECKYNADDSTGQEAMTIGSSVTVNLFYTVAATGASRTVASGDKMYQGSAIVTGRSINNSQSDMQTISLSLQGSGALSNTALAT